MEVTINYNGQAVAVEVTLEVYEFLDRADHKTENLFHEQERHRGQGSGHAGPMFRLHRDKKAPGRHKAIRA